jgi:hypothetical protein
MNHFAVNGISLDVPFAPETPFQELLTYLKQNLVVDHAYISSLRVNGTEISEHQEKALAMTPCSQFTSVEVFTAHPREIAEETLQSLIEFSGLLEKFCARIGQQAANPKFYMEFSKLMDGISTLTEGIAVIKKTLQIEPHSVPPLDALETDLLSILQEMLAYQEKKKTPELASLIRERLRENLQNWRDVALPALIRSRDS